MTTANTAHAAALALGVDLYGRQSMGNAKSIAEQLALGRDRAEAEAWPVRAVYSDEVSASRHARKAREDWPKLLADIALCRIGVVWLWESSRGDRKLSAWAEFLERCRDAGVLIYVETHGRLYDMTNPRDWRTLAEDGVDNEYESAKIAVRVTRAATAAAAAGEITGKAPYGYVRRYELTRGGKRILLGQEADPAEAPVVREIFAEFDRGQSLRAITAALNKRGTRTRKGGLWTTTQIRCVLLNYSYIGKRVHMPGARGCRSVPGAGAAITDAVWPALVGDEVFYAVRAILLDPRRTTRRPGGAKHFLSALAVCGACGDILTVAHPKQLGRRPHYRCRAANHVTHDVADLDEYVTAEILATLAEPAVWAKLAEAERADDAELLAARGELAEITEHLAAMRRLLATRKLSAEAFADAEPAVIADRDRAAARVTELEAPEPLRFLRAGPALTLAERWLAAPLPARRAIVRALVRVKLNPTGRPGKRAPAAAERTSVEWIAG
jgi:DNA invertase Pin-like site-specific DNA recombinase